jgi:hypothetical protein
MQKQRAWMTICGAAVLIAGCGGGSETKTVTVPATTPAVTTEAATTPTTTVTVSATETTAPVTTETVAAADDSRQDPITVKGRRGDAFVLLGQYATTVSGKPKGRVKVKVTLDGMRGPFSGFDLAAGRKLIGFDVTVTNIGAKRFSDPLPSGQLILGGGDTGKQTNLISGSNASPCDNPSLKLEQGESKKVCIAFDVPKRARLVSFQFATDSGYGDTGLWRLG